MWQQKSQQQNVLKQKSVFENRSNGQKFSDNYVGSRDSTPFQRPRKLVEKKPVNYETVESRMSQTPVQQNTKVSMARYDKSPRPTQDRNTKSSFDFKKDNKVAN